MKIKTVNLLRKLKSIINSWVRHTHQAGGSRTLGFNKPLSFIPCVCACPCVCVQHDNISHEFVFVDMGDEGSAIHDTRVKNIIEELPEDEKFIERNYLSQIVENKDVLRQMMALQGIILLVKPEVIKVYKVGILINYSYIFKSELFTILINMQSLGKTQILFCNPVSLLNPAKTGLLDKDQI